MRQILLIQGEIKTTYWCFGNFGLYAIIDYGIKVQLICIEMHVLSVYILKQIISSFLQVENTKIELQQWRTNIGNLNKHSIFKLMSFYFLQGFNYFLLKYFFLCD